MDVKITKQSLYNLCLFTLVGFSFIAALIMIFWHNTPFIQIFEAKLPVYKQLAIGSTYGLISGGLALVIINLQFFKKDLSFFKDLVVDMKLQWYDVLIFSFCAGVGEEILFRGALQPSLGVYWTAILFVALHGYLNPQNWRITIYGVFMTLVVIGFGHMNERFGIYAAIIAHFMIDVILFSYLKKN